MVPKKGNYDGLLAELKCNHPNGGKVSHEAWEMWLKESVKFINTYRVDLSSREGAEFMIKQIKIWCGFETGDLAATAWTPPKEGEDGHEGHKH